MGSGQSSVGTAPTGSDAGISPSNRRSRMSSLAGSGRYAVLKTPNGGTVHVLGVYPCATQSEEEAHDLVMTVKPHVVYVDVHPELLSVLDADVRAGRTLQDGWRIPETTPTFMRYDGAGWMVSVFIRNLLADNEILGLLGAEGLGAYKAGIRANLLASGGLSSKGVGKLACFPLALEFNNGEAMERPSHLSWMVLGNASTGSSALTALIGNPLTWFTVSDEPTRNVAEVDATAAIPAEGYFTRSAVHALQAELRGKANKAAARATSSSHDLEADAQARESEARAKADETQANALALRGLSSQKQSQAIAWHLHNLLDGMEREQQLDGHAVVSGSPSASSSKPVAVALINLGSMASLQRNWSESRPVSELYPPAPAWQDAVGYGAWGVLGGSTLWLGSKAGRRFPRTTGVFGVLTALATAGAVYSATYGDWARYGSFVRQSLARPRVTSPLPRPNK